MTTPTQPQAVHTQTTKQSIGVFTIIVAVVTMLAVRWSGYAALPYIVIFAPVLTLAAVLALAVVLSLIAAALTAGGRNG